MVHLLAYSWILEISAQNWIPQKKLVLFFLYLYNDAVNFWIILRRLFVDMNVECCRMTVDSKVEVFGKKPVTVPQMARGLFWNRTRAVLCWFPEEAKKLFCSLNRPSLLWEPSTFCSTDARVNSLGEEWQGFEAEHSSLSSAEFTNAWSYTYFSPFDFMAYTGATSLSDDFYQISSTHVWRGGYVCSEITRF
jgi:hypothetical protein